MLYKKIFERLIMVVFSALAAFSAHATILWSADHETGDFSQWNEDDLGGMFNSGTYECVISSDRAHTGTKSMRAKIWTDAGSSGVRAFRWGESRANRGLCYSAWFYIPDTVKVNYWWQIFQFKSKRDAATQPDPFWYLQIDNRADGTLMPKLGWWNGLTVEGPHQGESGFRTYQTDAVLPIRQWFHLEFYLYQSKDFDGRVTVWLNGDQIHDQTNVRTGYDNCDYNAWCTDNQWSINNYGESVLPNPLTLYMDDAVISTTRIGVPSGTLQASCNNVPSKGFFISHNAAMQMTYIFFPVPGAVDMLRIYDINGACIREMPIQPEDSFIRWNTAGAARGVYVVRSRSKGRIVAAKKFVLEK